MTTTTIEPKPMTTDEPLILTETDGNVAIIRINRPKVLNALNPALMTMMTELMEAYDQDDDIYVIVLTGSDRAFAAGADIGDMAEQSTISMYKRDQFATWERIKKIKKPIVAAVSGFALGGGCELVLQQDQLIP